MSKLLIKSFIGRDSQIHVFDSFPCSSYHTPNRCVWRFSHEVLKSGGCSWFEIPTPDEEIRITSHTMVGNRIYAVGRGMYYVFHSNTAKWRARPGKGGWLCPSPPEKLWHVLDRGFARCVGEYPFPIPLGGEAKVSEPLYVVIALVCPGDREDRTSLVAYLVTPRGRVVCFQRLPCFYEKPVQPGYMKAGTIIDVDEEGTMCSIVNGDAILHGKIPDWDYLFINTFGVEMLTDAAPKIQQVWEKGRKAWPVEDKFVGIDIKAKFIYKTDAIIMASDLPANDLVHSIINKYLHRLRKKKSLILRKRNRTPVYKKHNLILQNNIRKLRFSKYRVDAMIDVLHELLKKLSAKSFDTTRSRSHITVPPLEIDLRSRMNEDETKEPRYLCVSNGCVICCLDLKQGQGQSLTNARDVQPLPKVTTLKLMEERRLPVSVGLFKSGSHAYMIGGQHFPPSVEDPGYYTDPFYMHEWGENPRGYNLYRTICSLHFTKGTSHVTYRLCLKDDATLSPTLCDSIGKLNKPKFWPIVEKIEGQTHVFDSYPSKFDDDPNCDWIFSHEVLKQVIWTEIPTPDEEIFIKSHAVVGDRIYAVGRGKFLLFDSKAEKWEARPAVEVELPAKKVWDILDLGIARCAGEFPLGGEAKASDRLYVLIAVVGDAWNDGFGTSAVAYLVTPKGRVVCFQRLPRFFEKPVEPWLMEEGTIIDVDEDGKKMCAIVNATALINGKRVDDMWSDYYLFINTFAVEMCADAAPEIRKIWAQGRKAWPVEEDFVRVDVEDKDRYVFKTDAKLEGDGDLPGFPGGVQACFL